VADLSDAVSPVRFIVQLLVFVVGGIIAAAVAATHHPASHTFSVARCRRPPRHAGANPAITDTGCQYIWGKKEYGWVKRQM